MNAEPPGGRVLNCSFLVRLEEKVRDTLTEGDDGSPKP